jgi:formate hydrogenlyase subunit 6/NADH:ubiquinone oxidoreductase subunit I
MQRRNSVICPLIILQTIQNEDFVFNKTKKGTKLYQINLLLCKMK